MTAITAILFDGSNAEEVSEFHGIVFGPTWYHAQAGDWIARPADLPRFSASGCITVIRPEVKVCGPNCAGCWVGAHEGHDVGYRHEDGSLYSATCHDCDTWWGPHICSDCSTKWVGEKGSACPVCEPVFLPEGQHK